MGADVIVQALLQALLVLHLAVDLCLVVADLLAHLLHHPLQLLNLRLDPLHLRAHLVEEPFVQLLFLVLSVVKQDVGVAEVFFPTSREVIH